MGEPQRSFASFNPWPFWLRCHDLIARDDQLLICRRMKHHRGTHKNWQGKRWDRNDDVHRVCGECFHVYPTKQSLLDAHNEVRRQMGYQRTELGDGEFFCAHCLHDF